jgi:large subunit ribosomal protein L10
LEQIEALTVDDLPERWYPRMSLNKARKYAKADAIRKQLDKTFFIMSYNIKYLNCTQIAELREYFPITVKARGLKGSLVRKAAEGSEWAPYFEYVYGRCAEIFVFVEREEDLKPTIQAWLKAKKDFGLDEKAAKAQEKMEELSKPLEPSPGGMLRDDWSIIEGKDLQKYKDFPTRLDLIAQVAGSIKQVPTKLAKATKQLPQKTAIGIKKIVEKMEEEGKATVGDAVA